MILETYIHRDTKESIKIDEERQCLFIGTKENYIDENKMKKINKLYKYNKEIFKEFIENIYTKYDFDIVIFFINNKITLGEIKQLNDIILFYVDFNYNIVLSDYEINIVIFFKYLYSQPYQFISYKLFYKYFDYLKENKKKLNKYNKFPHNIYSAYNISKNNKIKRNDKKDIIIDVNNFYIKFYGSRGKYYITYKNKKYDLLNDNDLLNISFYLKHYTKIIYLSEYYKYSSLYNIILSFKDKEYYTKTIKEDIFYLLKDSYKNMNRNEIDKIQNFILKNKFSLFLPGDTLFINDFKKNLYIMDYLSLNDSKINFTNIVINKDFYNKRNRVLSNIYHKDIFKKQSFKTIKTIDNIIIKEISLLEFFNSINKNEYLQKDINTLLYSYIYLCIDKKSGEKLFIYKSSPISDNKYIVKFLNKEYSQDFLERIEKLQI